MRRVAVRVMVFMLIGVAISFGSAWGCIFWHVFVARPYLGASHGGLEAGGWPLTPPEGWPQPESVHVARGWGYELRLARGTATSFDGDEGTGDALLSGGAASLDGIVFTQLPTTLRSMSIFRRQSGWPLPCVQSSWVDYSEWRNDGSPRPRPRQVDLLGRGWSWRMYYERGIPSLRVIKGVHFNLPLEPVWGAMTLNAAFWGLAAWMALRGAWLVRQRLRALRGLCPACCYPAGASDVCTECGRPVRAKSEAAA